jgi:hypothetical protein
MSLYPDKIAHGWVYKAPLLQALVNFVVKYDRYEDIMSAQCISHIVYRLLDLRSKIARAAIDAERTEEARIADYILHTKFSVEEWETL